MRYRGRIINWNDDKGFGFVEPDGGGNRAFVHIKSFARGSRRPADGDTINYKVVQDRDSRYEAIKISFVHGITSQNKRKAVEAVEAVIAAATNED